MESTIERIIEEQTVLDRVADPIERGVAAVLDRAPGVASVLHGDWLGHPLHAAMVDIPVGSWSAAMVMDLIEVATGSKKLRGGADMATTIGLVGALGAAVAGLADWSTTRGADKRVGFVHGVTNMVIAGLYGGSLLARKGKKRGLGVALSAAGYGLLLFSAWLGGELTYRRGVGVRSEALRRPRRSEAGARRVAAAHVDV